jgi:hypothetical protein
MQSKRLKVGFDLLAIELPPSLEIDKPLTAARVTLPTQHDAVTTGLEERGQPRKGDTGC